MITPVILASRVVSAVRGVVRSAVRGGTRAATVALLPLLVLAAAPAHAEAAEGWDSIGPDKVDPIHALLVLLIAPVGVIAVITLLALLPNLIRREPIWPRVPGEGEAEWIGGPDKDAKAITAGAAGQGTGGASGSW